MPSGAGGKALLQQRGREYFVELGRKGGQATAAKLRGNVMAALISILDMVAETARTNSNWSSTIPKAINVSSVEYKDGKYEGYVWVDISEKTGAPEARAFEYGSGERATIGSQQSYIIRPKNAKSLAFHWVYPSPLGRKYITPESEDVVLQSVQHPGVEARPYLRPAVEKHKAEIKKILGKAFKDAVVGERFIQINVP